MAISVLNDRRPLACSCASQRLSRSTNQSLQSCHDPANNLQDHTFTLQTTNELATTACRCSHHICNNEQTTEIKSKLYSKIQNVQPSDDIENTPSFKGFIRCESVIESKS